MKTLAYPSPQKAPGGSRGTPRRSCSRLQRLSSPPLPPGEGRGEGAPRAFTLVELLVVIGIIALLAALLTPVVMRSLASARNAAIKAEIDMLHMAMMNYQTEYGVLPPCQDTLFPIAPAGYKAGGEAAKHVKRIFPRCTDPTGQLNAVGSIPLRPVNALAAWLSGFTTDPTSPLVPAAARVKLFDFDRSRINAGSEYSPAGKRNSPYIYIPASQYRQFPYLSADVSVPGAHLALPTPAVLSAAAFAFSDLATAANAPSSAFANPDTFQILCAGRDEIFGTDDDLSNFWPGTRREYIESLQE